MINLQNLNLGEEITDTFLVINSELKMTVKQKPYIDMTLSNSSGTINAKLWDAKKELMDIFYPKFLVKVKAKVDKYNDQFQLNIDKYKAVTDVFLLSDYIYGYKRSNEDTFNDILDMVDQTYNDKLKSVVLDILISRKESFIKNGASKEHHHNYFAGLLEHTYELMKSVEYFCDKYKNLNKNLLICAAAIHDIAKIDEMNSDEYGFITEYTPSGELLGHLALGLEEIILTCVNLNIDPKCEEIMLLKHMIISHHGIPEYGSIKYPMFKEAELLYYIDVIDCKMNMFDRLSNTLKEGEFSNRQWSLDNRKIYKFKEI